MYKAGGGGGRGIVNCGEVNNKNVMKPMSSQQCYRG